MNCVAKVGEKHAASVEICNDVIENVARHVSHCVWNHRFHVHYNTYRFGKQGSHVQPFRLLGLHLGLFKARCISSVEKGNGIHFLI